MLENLTQKLEGFVKNVTGQSRMTPENVKESLGDVRRALLEADVSYQVVKDLMAKIEERATGQEVLRGVSPGQQVIRVVHEELTSIMGGGASALVESPRFPTVIMVAGLQGSGKTTFCGKLAYHLRENKKKRALLASADVHRPAAIEQLRLLAEGAGLDFWLAPEGTAPEAIAKGALEEARRRGFDYLIFDIAGRLHIDDEMMQEAEILRGALHPHQILLVVDGMSGRDAVNAAQAFKDRLGVDGLVLSKMDGDARGGAALSIRAVTGVPVLFLGTGEKVEAMEIFHPDRLASRILGMGDVLTLVERAQERVDQQQAERMAEKLRKSDFNLEDFLDQMREMKKMGPLAELMKMIPGMPKIGAEEIAGGEKQMKVTEAIILSMTPGERRRPQVLNASRRRRIAAGSGTSVQAVNKLMRDFEGMQKMIKQMGKGGMARKGFRAGSPRFR
jgi:signal recognition particle subunit SRP54